MRISFRYQRKYLPTIAIGFIASLSIILLSFNHVQAQQSFHSYSVEVEEPIEMLPVEGRTMMLGSDESSYEVEVQVNSFWMGKYEITWLQ